MTYLCSVASQLSDHDWLSLVAVSMCLRIDTGVILVGDAIQTNQGLVLTEINGRQVRNWIV